MVKKTPGATANFTGRQLENFVEETLKNNSWKFIEKNKFRDTIDESNLFSKKGGMFFTREYLVGKTLYDTNWKIDFLVSNLDGKIFGIECKWQQSSGSVDEKFPYLVLNIKEKCPYPCIIIVDGDGYKPKAKEWLNRQVDEKLLAVLSLNEFVKFTNKDELNAF